MKIQFTLPACLMALLITSSAQAVGPVQPRGTANLSFHGILKQYPCHISNDETIEIHFGKVGIKKVDGKNYTQNIPYTVSCEGEDPAANLMLSIVGQAAVFDNTVVQSSVADLGIKVYQDGQEMKINTPVAINLNAPPVLNVVPVQKNGATLAAQEFTATATLKVEYQ